MNKISKRRLAENQVVFRKANEQLKVLIDELSDLPVQRGEDIYGFDRDEKFQFFCECSDEKCRMRIELSYDDYEKIHERKDTFAIIDGHDVREIEDVIRRIGDYSVVRKLQVSSQTVEKLNPTQLDNA